jgi:uncharacterized integral membrane protein
MKTLLKAIVLIPLGLALVGFALANRTPVTVSYDLFEQGVLPWQTAGAPLYVVLFATLALGVVIGGSLVWLSQGRHRRAASQQRLEAHKLRREIETLRPETGSTALAVR